MFGRRKEYMRIIKLSSKDIDFPDRAGVVNYFEVKLPNRDPVGQFLLTKGRIREGGIEDGEPLIFTYKGQITYTAKASSGRFTNSGSDRDTYPFYFIVDVNTIAPAQGSLADLEAKLRDLGAHNNILLTRGWPRIEDSREVDRIWNELNARTSR
jgi:hypothetical protein